MNNTPSEGQNATSALTDETLGKCVSTSACRVRVRSTSPHERGETPSSGYTGQGNKRRKQGCHFFSLQLTKSIVH